MLLGLTGLREVGKSSIARILREQHGFAGVHGFGPGRDMCVAYYRALGIDRSQAERMVYYDLKDTPCPALPGGVPSRYFMERLGFFMGVELGPAWTVEQEIIRAQRANPRQNLVAESMVYEGADLIVRRDMVVLRVIRPNHTGASGEHTDLAQRTVPYHYWLSNNGTLADLERKVVALLNTITADERLAMKTEQARPAPCDSTQPLHHMREIQ